MIDAVQDKVYYIVASVIRLYTRNVKIEKGIWFLWSKILSPHINTHNIQTKVQVIDRIKMNVDLRDLIQSYLFYFGIWEPTLTDFIRNRLSHGDVFVDVGANIGYFSCLASKRVGPSGAVYSVEASPQVYAALLKNLEQNNLSNVTAYNKAVHEEKSSISLYIAPDTNIGATTTYIDRDDLNYQDEVQVEADSLDNIVPFDKLTKARIIKVDVEGAEWFVFKGIEKSLEAFSDKTEWLIEISPRALKSQGGNLEDLLAAFNKHGYKAYEIENSYSPGWYARSQHSDYIRPLLLDSDKQKDVLFSKQDY